MKKNSHQGFSSYRVQQAPKEVLKAKIRRSGTLKYIKSSNVLSKKASKDNLKAKID